jgi:hypothetical protein
MLQPSLWFVLHIGKNRIKLDGFRENIFFSGKPTNLA